ncbi:NLR family CARD domain-containing protein 3-like isoform X2 [Pocillopora verrucosa]|uniref:NLR family CARD domain-containing protein 3-like isoform X2 n=1 Tax=Pocillopora verrucosa TaxID=203993 RepID=UPI00333E87C8
MASATPSQPSTKETSNYAQLCRLLVEVGSLVLREIFDRVCPPENLHAVLTNPTNHAKLQTLRKKRVLSTFQWGKLYPVSKTSVSSGNFDTSLLLFLLRNIFGLNFPASGRNNLPPGSDTSPEADITRIKFFRDRVFSHAANASVDDPTFSLYWNNIKDTFLHIGGTCYEEVIDDPTLHCMDADLEEHYQELLREWLKDDDRITDKVHEDEIVKKARKGGDMENSFEVSEQNSWERETVLMPGENTSAENGNGSPPELSVKLPKLCDLPAISSSWETVELPVDILLLAVEDCEFLSCFAYLKEPFKSYHISTGPVYFGSMGDDQGKKMKIALMRCSKGPDVPQGALSVSKDAILCLRPRAIFSVGACRGLNSKKVKLGDVVVSAKLITAEYTTPPSRDIGKLIKHVADGWKAPLQNSDEYNAKVHCDGVVLSISEANRDMIREHPEAIAVEMEGGGVYAAAHDFKTEWVVVKGIKDFVDETHSSSKKWNEIACVMAASVVANILNDPVIFQDWPHFNADSLRDLRDTTEKIEIEMKEVKETLCSLTTTVEKSTDEGIFDPTELINGIRQLYKTREGWLSPFPWCEEFQFFLGNIFTRLKVVRRKKTRGVITDVFVDMSSILDPYEECSAPRTVLIEGEPGMGKTTYCKKYAYDWATKQQKPQGCGSTAFKVVLLLKCRDIHSDVWEAIDDQLLSLDIDEKVKRQFFQFIRENQSSILLILDGLDELPSGKLSMFSKLIEGKVLSRCHIVATARHEAGKEVRKCCDALLQIEGFTKEHVIKFVIEYFKERTDLAFKLLQRMLQDENLREIAANPLNTALLCLLCEEFEGSLPESRAQLYLDMVECVLRRYRKRKGLLEKIEDLTNHYKPQLNHLGKVALNGLLDDKLDFNESELRNHAKDLTEFGFLSVQPGGSKLRQTLHYAFLHKSFQEFFAAFFICSQIQSKEMKPEELVSDPRYFVELKQILLFSCGILTMKCDEQVVALVKSLTNKVNKNEGRGAKIVWEAINECKREKSDFHSHLLKSFGTGLNVTNLDLKNNGISAAGATCIAEAIKVNKTLTNLDLQNNGISAAGATCIAEAIKVNKTLTNLDLSWNGISAAGATCIAEAIKVNKTLTNLDLSWNGISDAGATCIAEAIKVNKTLTNLDLRRNGISDAGATCIAEAIKVNKTLTNLDLRDNGISAAGATCIAEAIKVNKTLTNLDLCVNGISAAGATCIAEAIKVNKTLTNLDLCVNGISDAGATCIAEAIKVNKTLTNLNLDDNDISAAGATCIAEAIKVNKTLTNLHLSYNGISAAGATCIAEAIKVNKTLTNLDLSGNGISDAGATCIAEAIKVNKTLTNLHLDDNDISAAGATCIAEAIKVNKTLTNLDLSGNGISDAGATCIAEAIKVNKTLTNLDLSGNGISDAGATCIAEAIKVNKTLTNLDLRANGIRDAGATCIAEAIKVNKTLTNLDLCVNGISAAGATCIAEAIKVNKTLT